jgi:hypothetical protein
MYAQTTVLRSRDARGRQHRGDRGLFLEYSDQSEAAALSLAAAPTIGVQKSIVWALLGLCYPAVLAGTRGCPSAGSLSISNTGGGVLDWTATKSATWIKRSPSTGTAPSTMKVWVEGTGLPRGDYSGWIKVWATGATNSPQTVSW